MPLSNKYNLPQPLVRAIENDPYDAGDADISTTRLIAPPQIVQLTRAYRAEITEDVADSIYRLLGQACHAVLERSADPTKEISEKRYVAELDGWKISGAVDLIEGGTLVDYKVTSAWTIVFKSRIEEWTQQANINRWLAYQNGVRTIEKAENVAILRDWSKKEYAKNADRGYPPIPVAVQPLELWSLEKAEAYIRERVALHKRARAGEQINCTDEERWKGTTKTGTVYRRCEGYCAVAPFCPQNITHLAEKVL